MLYCFDLDGTLIRSFMDGPRDVDAYDKVEVLPGVEEKLCELELEGHTFAIVTNQGGVAFGYQTEDQVYEKIERARVECGIAFAPAYVCLAHPKASVEKYRQGTGRRKPSPAMLLEAMRDHGVEPDQTVFVGDMDTDHEAAVLCGVDFAWAEEFFCRTAATT